ncbi:hypothetical protein KSP39_PZI010870 [Platanthera zijinensis]|uniref:Uncharacterized protein n=1 Tax=Platanthera zijinensis TaxID=2320716 RepID=A0AAP0G5M7_9ASPA
MRRRKTVAFFWMSRSSKISEPALCSNLDSRFSRPNGSSKVFFLDSLKFFLSLYGHKLPVLCMDISSDGDLIVTGSADKNLKIWGLDFGDCHKSLFAHSDSVMDVKFVQNTHYMFSVGKDRLIKEEREKRLQEMFESDLETNENKYAPREELPEEGSVAVPGKKTRETITAMDMIIDALDTAEAELKRIDEYNNSSARRACTAFINDEINAEDGKHVLRDFDSFNIGRGGQSFNYFSCSVGRLHGQK